MVDKKKGPLVVCETCEKKYRQKRGLCVHCLKLSCEDPDFGTSTHCARCGVAKRDHKLEKGSIKPAAEGSIVLALGDCCPNSWNPNSLTGAMRDKVWLGMLRTLSQARKLPPIVVMRSRKGAAAPYTIIDGQQRWQLLCDNQDNELVQQYRPGQVDVIVLDVDEQTARLMTSQLNWNRGEADPERYAGYIGELLATGMSVAEAATLLPESEDELRAYRDLYGIKIVEVDVAEDEIVAHKDQREALVEMKLFFSQDQYDVVQGAISRVSSLLKGKNLQARALELICGDSIATPIESYEGRILKDDPVEKKAKKKGSMKDRLRERSKKGN